MEKRDPASSRAGDGDDFFECYNCGRRYRWRADISGRTLRCTCGSKVRCPELHDETITAHESLEDTVTDVVLEEALDVIETTEKVEDAPKNEQDVQELFAAQRRRRGVFGLALGGEVLLYGAMSILGVALAILAIMLGKYFWWWIAAAVLIGPFSWIRLGKRWKAWSAGRSFMESLADVFGMRDEGNQTQ